MRVVITVEGVSRDLDVASDLLDQTRDMGDAQDDTEMVLLKAFGSAYREAILNSVAALPTVESATVDALPTTDLCRCGHKIRWHGVGSDGGHGRCAQVWAVDERDPSGPQSACACAEFVAPVDRRPALPALPA